MGAGEENNVCLKLTKMRQPSAVCQVQIRPLECKPLLLNVIIVRCGSLIDLIYVGVYAFPIFEMFTFSLK